MVNGTTVHKFRKQRDYGSSSQSNDRESINLVSSWKIKERKGKTGADSVNTNQTIVCSCLVCRRYSANTNLFKTTTSCASYFFFFSGSHWYSKWLVRFDIGWCKANPHIYRTPWKALSVPTRLFLSKSYDQNLGQGSCLLEDLLQRMHMWCSGFFQIPPHGACYELQACWRGKFKWHSMFFISLIYLKILPICCNGISNDKKWTLSN